jgi:hypothetical protein
MIILSFVVALWVTVLLSTFLFQSLLTTKNDAEGWLTDLKCLLLGQGSFDIDQAVLTIPIDD